MPPPRSGADDHAEDDARRPRAAPSTASDSAKQFASFASAPVAPSARREVAGRAARPLSQVELAFLTRPVAGEIAPGDADADGAARAGASLERRATSPTIAATSPS